VRPYNQLSQQQRWGSIIGGVLGIVVGIALADRFITNQILNFIAIMIFAAGGNFAGLYVTRNR
jgi:hypothetical protein